jgi:hypothetical protein
MRAQVWENGTLVDLGGIRLNKSCDRPPHGNTFAIAINNKGVIVGYSDVFGYIESRHTRSMHAVLWTPRGGNPSQ